jgi:hypothetical protein
VGEKQNQPFQLSFNSSLKVDFQGSRVTSDGGLILVRERPRDGAWMRLAAYRRKLVPLKVPLKCSVGGKRLYTRNRRRAKKLIPDKISTCGRGGV